MHLRFLLPLILIYCMGVEILAPPLFCLVSSAPPSSNTRCESVPPPTQPLISNVPQAAANQVSFDVVDVRGLGLTSYETWVLSSLEGHANKNSSRMYVVWDNDAWNWLQTFNNTDYIGYKRIISNLTDIIQPYAGEFNGLIVFDPSDGEMGNIATPLAGVDSALLVPQQVFDTVHAAFHSLPVIKNVTADLQAAGATTRAAEYAYAFTNYYPLCNKTAFAMFSGAAPANLREFLVANNLFTTWEPLYVHTDVPTPPLDPDPPAEHQLFETILATYPDNTVIYGYMWPDGGNEGVVIKMISAANKYLIASDWISNLAFFSHMQLPTGYQFHQNRTATVPTITNKIYLTGIWSDGDNIQYVQGFMHDILWNDATRGQVPTGWEINPSLYNLAPYILKYYYDSASANDCIVAGLSGAGYCKFDYFTNQTALENFLHISMDLMNKTDMTETRGWQIDQTANIVTSIYQLNGIFEGYGGPFQYRTPEIVNGVPIIWPTAIDSGNWEQVPAFIERLHAAVPNQPVFLYALLHCWSYTQENWTKLVNELESLGYVDVERPDVFAQLAKTWGGDQVQGYLTTINILSIAGFVALLGVAAARQRKKGEGQ